MFCRIHRAPSRRFIARSFYAGAIFFLVSARALADEAADSFPKTLRKAEQGDASGQNDLGTMYYNGEVVPKDYAKALEWFTKAAEQGDAWAQAKLGFTYHMGRGVPEDDVMAYMWFNIAASSAFGDESASQMRDSIRQTMTPEQIAEGQRMSREWSEKHKPASETAP